VVKIHREGAAFNDGRLRVGDKILTINGLKVTSMIRMDSD
jgi:C-terminal processing protease CtpA/Prc